MCDSIIELIVPFEDMFSGSHKEAIINSIIEYPGVNTLRTLLIVESHNLLLQGRRTNNSCAVSFTFSIDESNLPEEVIGNVELTADFVLKNTYTGFKGMVKQH